MWANCLLFKDGLHIGIVFIACDNSNCQRGALFSKNYKEIKKLAQRSALSVFIHYLTIAGAPWVVSNVHIRVLSAWVKFVAWYFPPPAAELFGCTGPKILPGPGTGDFRERKEEKGWRRKILGMRIEGMGREGEDGWRWGAKDTDMNRINSVRCC